MGSLSTLKVFFPGKKCSLSFDKFFTITSNSSIKGNIDDSMSNYSIETSTSNGKSNLPNKFGTGNKKLTAHTFNGSINIVFNK